MRYEMEYREQLSIMQPTKKCTCMQKRHQQTQERHLQVFEALIEFLLDQAKA